jgi:(R)-2-hydroxyacyl-CoA dehydratese activating ATPase
MRESGTRVAAGVDAGTECVKAVIVGDDGRVLGRAVAPARGYFQACSFEVLAAALDDAQVQADDLVGVGATGFAMNCVPNATFTATDGSCHALGAFHHLQHAMTLVDIGGRDPHVIRVDGEGRRVDARGVRRCASGVGSFLMFAARHLDVPPSRLQELAAGAERAAPVSSYCSVFSSSEVLERLREGATREEIALGCLTSVAERIVEIGGFEAPVVVCGGVVEYFPGVLQSLQTQSGMEVCAIPDAIFTGALGAGMKMLRLQLEA